MTPVELEAKLAELIADWEHECVEFKRAGNDFDTDTIGRYFSALANEANVRTCESGCDVEHSPLRRPSRATRGDTLS